MADIILAGDNFSLKKLRSAAEQLEDAQNLMQKVYDAVFSTSFWAEASPFALLDGSKNMNVFDGTIDELHTYQQRVHQKEETLRTLAQRIEAAVRELAETDQSFRGKLGGESEKNTWERITGAGRSVGQIVSAAALSLIGAINGLFSSDGTVTGEVFVDPHEKIKPITQDEIDKQNLYIKYENDKYIDKTELKMVVETSKNAEEAEQRIQAIRENAGRLKQIELQINWKKSMKQGDYQAFYEPYGYNAGCCAMSYAMGLTIVDGVERVPTKYWRYGSTYYDEGGGREIGYDANVVYEQLEKGLPTMYHFNYANGGSHYVLIIGVKDGANKLNLKNEDFIVIDPGIGQKCSLQDVLNSYNNPNPNASMALFNQ